MFANSKSKNVNKKPPEQKKNLYYRQGVANTSLANFLDVISFTERLPAVVFIAA
jgi:hypothetical protein